MAQEEGKKEMMVENRKIEYLGKYDCYYCKRKKMRFYLSATGNEYICYKCGMRLKGQYEMLDSYTESPDSTTLK